MNSAGPLTRKFDFQSYNKKSGMFGLVLTPRAVSLLSAESGDPLDRND